MTVSTKEESEAVRSQLADLTGIPLEEISIMPAIAYAVVDRVIPGTPVVRLVVAAFSSAI
jgi:hypothetical protein